MKEFLLVEKTSSSISQSKDNSYILEGIFTELGTENRNGRIYTKEEFLPHLKTLQKIVEQGKCVGELDHPKVFETSLKNASHVIEKIWYDDSDNKVYGRIKLLDTDSGKNAKALVDAGVPLHISSRAAGTVSENKKVKMHKLFTYDLVADPGFENAVLNTVNESYGFDTNPETANFFIYDISENKNKTIHTATGPISIEGYVTEQELNKFTKFTNEAIKEINAKLDAIAKVQEALSTQADEIAETINTDINENINTLKASVTGISKWAEHVVEEFNEKEEEKEEKSESNIADKIKAIEEWSEEVTKTVTALEKWSADATNTITAIEEWSEEVTETVTAVEKWSEHVTETVSAVEKWSDEASDTVSAIEEWTNEAARTITAIEEWSEHATETVSHLEENVKSGKNITKTVIKPLDETYMSNIYTKIDSITETAKKQKAEKELELNESKAADEAKAKEQMPIWLSLMPGKYSELWESLSETKKVSITKRANICEFSSENSVKEFWDATFAGATLDIIKESATFNKQDDKSNEDASRERKNRIIEEYNKNFKKY